MALQIVEDYNNLKKGYSLLKYDYENLKKEYNRNIKKLEKDNKTSIELALKKYEKEIKSLRLENDILKNKLYRIRVIVGKES